MQPEYSAPTTRRGTRRLRDDGLSCLAIIKIIPRLTFAAGLALARPLRSATDMADHVVVVSRFAHLIPLILLVAERNHRLVQLLEFFIFLGNFGKQLVCCLERDIQNVRRER